MAQRVQVTLVCDVHGDETPGTETIAFSLDGTAYEIDVCNQHGGQLRDAFAAYVGSARKATGRVAAAGRRGRRSGGVDYDPAAVRAWARSKGIKVSERGRIGAGVVEQFRADGH